MRGKQKLPSTIFSKKIVENFYFPLIEILYFKISAPFSAIRVIRIKCWLN